MPSPHPTSLLLTLSLLAASPCHAAEAREAAAATPPLAASAASPPADTPSATLASRQSVDADNKPGSGRASRAWLAAQASGQQASAQPPTLSGPVLRKVHERYVNSFGQAIPDRFPSSR